MGGGGNDAANQAAQQEANRQARIKAATDAINSIFDDSNRNQLYSNERQSVYDLNSNEVNRQAGVAERQNRFGLARNGLMGGSVDVDSNAELNRITDQGLLQASGIADQASADLQAADEKTRSNLISMAQSGIDTGTAAQMATQGLKVNADNTAATNTASTIGNLFNNLTGAYLANQTAAGTNAGLNYSGLSGTYTAAPSVRYSGS